MIDFFFRDDFAYDEDGAQAPGVAREPRVPDRSRRPAGRPRRFHATPRSRRSSARFAEERAIKVGPIIHPARMAVSGKTKGAGLFEMMEVLGRERVVARMRRAAHADETTPSPSPTSSATSSTGTWPLRHASTGSAPAFRPSPTATSISATPSPSVSTSAWPRDYGGALQPAHGRHQPGDREHRVRRLHQGGRPLARLRLGGPRVLRLRLLREALRLRRGRSSARAWPTSAT